MTPTAGSIKLAGLSKLFGFEQPTTGRILLDGADMSAVPPHRLDVKLRRSLKVELVALQERVGSTFFYVTHDQEEALTMSDRLAS